MTFRIPLASPALLGNERAYVEDALLKNQLSGGEYVSRFETAFAAKLKTQHAIAVSSGTTALHLALLALGVNAKSRVRVPTLTYVATANAVRYCNAEVVFEDVDPETWGMVVNGKQAEFAIPVHLYGVPTTMRSHEGGVVEDAAEALGAIDRGTRASGTIGELGIFSFYGNKILTTGEGGMVVTNDDALAARVRFLRGQAMDPERRYWHTEVGYNYRMTNLQAAIGLGQLEHLDEHLSLRRAVIDMYHDRLQGVLELQRPTFGTVSAPWLFVGLLPHGIDRDLVMQKLTAEGIETRPTFPCVHQMPMFAAEGSFPVAEDISRRGICLPTFATMTEAQVEEVSAALRKNLW